MELEETRGEINSRAKEEALGLKSKPSSMIDSKFEDLNIIPSSAAGCDPNYKKTKTGALAERAHPYRRVSKNDQTSMLENSAESVISGILWEVIQKTVESEAADQDRLEEPCNWTGNLSEHLINTADSPSSDPPDLHPDHILQSKSIMKDCANVETISSCQNKTALQNWLQTKENEVNVILSELTESEEKLHNLVEDLADVDSLETAQNNINSHLEKNKDLPDKLANTESLLSDRNTVGMARLTYPRGVKKMERIADERKSKSKNNKSQQSFKSPLLRRKEIRTCLSLHEACESSDVLEEILTPALQFGNTENYLEGSHIRGTLTSTKNDRLKSYSIDYVEADSNFIDRNSVRNVRNHSAVFSTETSISSLCQAS